LADGINKAQFTPKGLSVNWRTFSMAALVCSGVNGPKAKIPKPPALLTAATSSGVEIQLIPVIIMGYLMFNS
jgi:hypothetical protein